MRQQKEAAQIQAQSKQSRIEELRKSIAEVDATQRSIEEQIYMISIENKQKEEDKEIILMLLPQVLKAIGGKTNNIKSFMAQFENEATKAKVIKLFHAFKIPYK